MNNENTPGALKSLKRRIAATVTRGAVRCSAWLGVADALGKRLRRKTPSLNALNTAKDFGEMLVHRQLRLVQRHETLWEEERPESIVGRTIGIHITDAENPMGWVLALKTDENSIGKSGGFGKLLQLTNHKQQCLNLGVVLDN